MQKRYFYGNLLLIILLIICSIVINYILDPSGIWKTSYDKQVLEPNRNYIKTKYIIENPEKYDSFIFGSSRAGYVEANLLKDSKYYNMSYSQGLPAEWLESIKLFLENGVDIKNVILAVDDFSFTVNPETHYIQPMRVPYSKLDTSLERFKMYLLRNPLDLYNRETIKGILRNSYPEGNLDLYGTGAKKLDFEDEETTIKKNLGAHLVDPVFEKPTVFYEEDRMEETLNDIKEIKRICDENNINLYVFLNPLYESTYLHNEELVKEIRSELSKITGFWDFTGLNDITTNKYYWYETSHYRLNVGRMILERIFNIDLGVEVPENFGVYIDKKI